MNLQPYLKGSLLQLRVIPNSSRSELKEAEGRLRLYLHSPPEKNRANQELVKFFKKELNLRVEIVKGAKGREKVIRIVS